MVTILEEVTRRVSVPVDEDTCLHEAGHAAMAFELDVQMAGMQMGGDPDIPSSKGTVRTDHKLPDNETSQTTLETLGEDTFIKYMLDRGRDEQVKHILVALGGPVALQRTKDVTDMSTLPHAGQDVDTLRKMCPDLFDKQSRYQARAEKALFGAAEDVCHIMDNPGVWKGIQALAAALLAEKKLTGEEARKIYFDARGPNQAVSSSSLKKIRNRLRRIFPHIDLATFTAEIKAEARQRQI